MIRLNLSLNGTAYYRQTANELARRLRMRKRLIPPLPHDRVSLERGELDSDQLGDGRDHIRG
jgi:hypothetical protein